MRKIDGLSFTAAAGLLSLALFGLAFSFTKKQEYINDQTAYLNSQTASIQKKTEKVRSQTEAQLLAEASNTNTASLVQDEGVARDKAKALFSQLYNVDYEMSEAKYESRNKIALQYADKNVLARTGMYGQSLSDIQKSQMKILQPAYKFYFAPEKGSTITGLAEVSYQIKSLFQKDGAFHVMYYSVTFDMNTKKFTEIKQLGQLE